MIRTALLTAACAFLAAAQPAPVGGVKDSATFSLYKNEERIATITNQWRPDDSLEIEGAVAMAGQRIVLRTVIDFDKAGLWTRIVQTSPAGVTTTVRDGDTARRTLKDKTEIVSVKPGALLFDNFGPTLMGQAIRHYDRAKGGKQAFPVIICPGVAYDGSLEFKDQVERSVAGKDIAFDRFIYALPPGVEGTVWADRDRSVYYAEVPIQHAAYVRDGYESLRQAVQEDPLLSKPAFGVKIESGAWVPMRDGVKLSTDLYLPQGAGRFPVILVRTPYKKEMLELQGRYYARRGYVVAVQDCRGRFGSQGAWEPFVNEPKDGHDTIEWLAAQPWSTGKVGMIGGSYVGWVQWWAASERPPHLATIIPNVAPPDPFLNIPYEHGAFFLTGAIWWANVLETKATADLSGAAMSQVNEKKYGTLLRALPVIDLDKTVLGKENPYWRKWIEHPVEDAWWAQSSFLDRLKDVNIPVFHQSGWFDGDGIGSKLNYLRMKEHGHPWQKLTLGPWGHTDTATRGIGDRDFGPEAVIDLQRDYLRWFDYWLKGVDNGVTKEPLVSLFVMRTNKWVHGDVYPLPNTRFEKWYLASGGSANTSKGDGRLTTELPSADSPTDRYTYDPGDPTPDPAFRESTEEQDKEVKTADQKKKEAEAYHNQVTGARRDILVYVTEPFQKSLTFAGPVSAVLYASSSARDTDWFVRLLEVDKEGKLMRLGSGVVRARFRNSTHKPQLLQPGKVYEYQLDLWQTGISIQPGHRLRIEVASASFPMFSRNLNTGGHNETETKYLTAQQTIHHSKQYPSHVLLPVVP